MKQRLLVMNGSKIVQTAKDGGWHNDKVEKAGTLSPGIYNIFNAEAADTSKQYGGVIIHSDNNSVYQQVGKKLVAHDASSFKRLPAPGSNNTIFYSDGIAISEAARKMGRAKAL